MADILLIEDDENMGAALKERLEADAHEVRLATEAQEGMAALKSRAPDVLFVDLKLPDKSGIELLDDIKADPTLGQTAMAITILTNLDDPEVAAEMKKRGHGYLVKADHTLDELAAYVKGQGDG